MRIGIDIDGVLFPWSEIANEVLVAEFGIEDPGPHTSWEYLRETITEEQWNWLWTSPVQKLVFGKVRRIYPGVVDMVNTFTGNPENKVHFVTHRDPRKTSGLTSAFLSLHFGQHPWAGLHVLQNGTPKHELADWDVFIDDKPQTVTDMLMLTGADVFAPQRPWNSELKEIRGMGQRFLHYTDPAQVIEALS